MFPMSSLLLRNFLLILFSQTLFIAPLLFFSDGFFLRRIEFPDKSTEKLNPVYKKAVILLVDALSFSFTDPKVPETDSHDYYSNHLKILREMNEKMPSQVLLYKFLADPPTTTMQRIKALSTGSLSTFIEIASNFFSSEIQEDSWIHQANVSGNGVVALGDDTWGGLFPHSFKRAHLLPSFNVKDLDTVDNGVLNFLFGELKKDDYSVLLAHFLGVDHCGHTFGRNHPEMERKLKQMDTVIRQTLREIDNDTILFVIGDHGMTSNGDHGGDSDLEMTSTLFAYAPKHNFDEQVKVGTVYQTDFIPTISLLLGMPIPFSNIGSLIDDFFPPSTLKVVENYDLNSKQLYGYFDKYFHEKPGGLMDKITASFTKAELATQRAKDCEDGCLALVKTAVQFHKDFHHFVRTSCEAAWIKFNMVAVIGGILGQCLALVSILSLISQFDSIPTSLILACICALISPLLLVAITATNPNSLFASDLLRIVLLNCSLSFVTWLLFRRSASRLELANLKYLIAVLPLLLGKFSNSFIIYEPYIALTAINFFVWWRVWNILSKVLNNMPGKLWRNLLTWPILSQLAYSLILSAIFRCLLSFVSCREEHGPYCVQSSFLSPLQALIADPGSKSAVTSAYLAVRFITSSVAVLVMPVFLIRLAKQRGNLLSNSISSWCYSHLLLLAVVSIIIDWFVQMADLKMDIPMSFLIFFPRTVYFVSFVIMISLIVNPLIFATQDEKQYIQDQFSEVDDIGPNNRAVMKTLYSFMKEKYQLGIASGQNLFVYGLGSVISASWQLFFASICSVVIMLLGDGLSLPSTLVLIAIFLFYKLEMANSGPSIAVMIHLLQTIAFYATGHHATWTHIKWQSAFVGFAQVPDFYAIPGAMIISNTFASNFFTILAIPFFVLWPVVEMNKLPSSSNVNSNGEENNKVEPDGECGFTKQPRKLANPLIRIALFVIAISGCEVLSSAIAACVLRRHLMAYKIFVPRLIFAVISFIINTPLLLASTCVPLYTLYRLSQWQNRSR